MSKEKEIQDEIEEYGEQLDRMEKCLVHLYKMLKWLVVKVLARDMEQDEHSGTGGEEILGKMLTLSKKLPDISDILDDVEKGEMTKVDKYFIYVEYKEDDIDNCLLEFTALESAQSYLLKNFKNDEKMRLFKGTEIGWMYQEQIHIAKQEEKK